ncbi:MAG TPA: MFS transporter [Streptosporangiaceae bacterium]|nr:MFS transporter [Streptosporangiaceae bacterium]
MSGRRRARRGLALLLAGDAVSITGTSMTTIAVPWFVLTTTGSAARAGVAAFVSLLPIVISAIFGGAIADRMGHRRFSVVSDLASGVLTAAIPVLFLTTGLGFAPMLALLFGRWLLASPGETARRALVPALAGAGAVRMERATAAFDAVSRGARMVGAPLAGVLIAVFGATRLGPVALLFVDAATFLVSALLIGCGVPRAGHDAAPPAGGRDLDGYLARLREGLAFLWREPVLRALSVMILVTNMLNVGWAQVLLPVYTREVLGDPRALGLLLGVYGGGAMVGALAYGAVGARLPRRKTYASCFLAGSVPVMLVFAVQAPFVALIGVQALSGLVSGALNPLISVVEFERIPARLRARVMGAGDAGAYAGMPVGGLLAGTLAGSIGLTATMLAFAAIYLVACLPPFVGKVWRGLDARIGLAVQPNE